MCQDSTVIVLHESLNRLHRRIRGKGLPVDTYYRKGTCSLHFSNNLLRLA